MRRKVRHMLIGSAAILLLAGATYYGWQRYQRYRAPYVWKEQTLAEINRCYGDPAWLAQQRVT